MNQFNTNANNNSFDFDFFETERDQHNNNSSTIITKAVIEPTPSEPLVTPNKKLLTTLKSNEADKEELCLERKPIRVSASPANSLEEPTLSNAVNDLTLFNCLAYSDGFSNDKICSAKIEDKDSPDNSLSDSTITSVSSDLTSVSRLSSISDSSCESDLSNDSTVPQMVGLRTEKNHADSINDTKNVDTESYTMLGTVYECDPEKVSQEAQNCIEQSNNFFIESTMTEFEYYENDLHTCDNESQASTSSDTDSGRNVSDNIYKPHVNLNIDLEDINSSEDKSSTENLDHRRRLSRKSSTSTIEEQMGSVSLASKTSSNSSIVKGNFLRGQNRSRQKKKELNLTFSREELIKIERDNMILLKKIMSYSKPRTGLPVLNNTLNYKKTSAAINRARQQKKIEQDNYILYSKINAMNRLKKVF